MRLRSIAALLVAGALCAGVPATAQPEACPATAVCYEGHELEFDAADGPVQFLVVATTVRTTTTLDGQSTKETVTVVEFVANGDTYEQLGDPRTYPKESVFATADVWDTFVPAEIGGE